MIGVREALAFCGALVGAGTATALGFRHGLLVTAAAGVGGFLAGLIAGFLYSEVLLDGFGDFAVGLLKRNRVAGGIAVAFWLAVLIGSWAGAAAVGLWALRVGFARGG